MRPLKECSPPGMGIAMFFNRTAFWSYVQAHIRLLAINETTCTCIIGFNLFKWRCGRSNEMWEIYSPITRSIYASCGQQWNAKWWTHNIKRCSSGEKKKVMALTSRAPVCMRTCVYVCDARVRLPLCFLFFFFHFNHASMWHHRKTGDEMRSKTKTKKKTIWNSNRTELLFLFTRNLLTDSETSRRSEWRRRQKNILYLIGMKQISYESVSI